VAGGWWLVVRKKMTIKNNLDSSTHIIQQRVTNN